MRKCVAFAMCVVVLSAFSSPTKAQMSMGQPTDTITLGAGCFWCVEAIFESIPGVLTQNLDTRGGTSKSRLSRSLHRANRSRRGRAVDVRHEQSGFGHDPEGVFCHTRPHHAEPSGCGCWHPIPKRHLHPQRPPTFIAEQAIEEAQSDWPNPIVTEVTDFDAFYPAEDYHQAYYELNKEAPYCRAVIAPKLAKFHKEFKAVIDLN